MTVRKLSSTRNRSGFLRTLKEFRRYWAVYLMMLPGLAYLFINNYMPMPGVAVAFKQYHARLGIWGSKWVGLKNFEYLFATSDAFVITRNTILYNLAFIITNTILAILVAVLLNELTGKRKKIYQSVILLPNLVSTVIISYLVFAFFSSANGFVNNTIFPALGRAPVNWYSEPQHWPFIIVFVYLWKTIGYSCILYYATLLGIDRSYYESAMIDGAGKIKQFFYITLPLLKPTIIMLTLMAVGRIFYSDFGLFYQVPMNQGALYATTTTLDTYGYRGLVQLGNISISSAAGLYQSTVGFILVLGANLLVRRIDRDSALF